MINKKITIFIIICSLLYVIYHLVTLIYSPIPWLDEENFADITISFLKNGQFYENARIIDPAVAKIDLAYGPVYFFIQAVITTLFGFNIFTFRMTNLFFGLFDLFLLYKVCKQLKLNNYVTILIILLTSFDPHFNQFLNSGRMDLVALFFFLCSYLQFMSIKNNITVQFYLKSILTGFLIACAFLTNPRILFSLSFYVFFFAYEVYNIGFKNIKHIIIKNLVVVVTFIGFFSIWIFVEFGSITHYFSDTYTNSPIIKEHIGITFVGLHLTYNLVMHLISLLCFCVLLVNKKVKENINIILFALPTVIVFLLLVNNGLIGRYYAMVVPFTSILIVACTVNSFNNLFCKIFTNGIITVFILIFIFKGLYIFVTLDQRDPNKYDKIISSIIPPGTVSVAGDFPYFYIIKNHKWKYQSLEENGTLFEKTAFFKSNVYEYIIINKRNINRKVYEKFFLNSRYRLIATLDDNDNGNDNKFFFHKIKSKLPFLITEGYAGYIYKYVGN